MNECPLCGNMMVLNGDYYRCKGNKLHAILADDREYGRYKSGEKDVAWLRFRMKVRLGKLVTGR